MTADVPTSASKSRGGLKDDAKDEAEQFIQKIQMKLTEAFDVFDGDKTRQVDVKEIPAIIYSLNLVPTLGELQDLISEMEEEDNSEVIRYEKYMTVMTDVLMNRRYRPANENMIMRAFQVLDTESRGYLTKDELIKYMTSEGEVFNSEEVNEMLQTCLAFAQPDSSAENPHIDYKHYISELVIEENAKEKF